MFASIKLKEYPDLYQLDEDPLFNYADNRILYFLQKYIKKETNTIDISKINADIFHYTHLLRKNDNNKIYVSGPQYFQIKFTSEPTSNLKSYQKMHFLNLVK